MYRILLIGDSITGGFPNSVAGYVPEVRGLLAEAAQVDTLMGIWRCMRRRAYKP